MFAETLSLEQEALLIFRQKDGLLHLLDATAHLIWQATELGLNAETIYAALPESSNKPGIALIQNLQSQWRKQRMIADTSSLPHTLWIKPGSQVVSLKTNHSSLYQYLQTAYQPYLIPKTDGVATAINVTWLGQEQVYLVQCGDSVPTVCHSFDEAVLSACYEITELAIHESPRLFVAHAAALQGATGGFLIPAQAGKGKSTLTAALLKQGYRLINDDVVPINPDGSATALNLPLKIKSGAWETLSSLYPELSNMEAVTRQNIRLKHLPITPISCCSPGSRHRLDFMLIPEYAPTQVPQYQRLTQTQALAALLTAEPFFPHPLTAGYLQQIVDWAAQLKAFSLRYRDTQEALSLLECLINEDFLCETNQHT